MSHPLDGAHLRVEWAAKRLEELRALVSKYAENEVETNDIDAEFDIGSLILTPSQMGEPPAALSIHLGEVVYHLRSALDYLIFELARADSGKPMQRTQFPIESTPSGFAGRRNTYLLGVSEKHVNAIKLLQPCEGCDWTGDLANISNPDKHRLLIPTFGAQQGSFAVTIIPPGDVSRVVGKAKPLRGDPAGRYVDVECEVTAFSVTFGQGEPPIVETLELLMSRVSQALDAFNSCFEGSCVHVPPT